MAKEMYLRDLPLHVIEDIVNRLEDGRFAAWVQFLGKDWSNAGKNVRSLRVIVLDVYHKQATGNNSVKSLESDGAGFSTSGSVQPKTGGPWNKPFKAGFWIIVKDKRFIVQCRIEVEGKLQLKTVPEGDRRRTDFLLTDPWFLRQWLPGMGSTLQHLCRVDYGRLANMLKPIKTLDLRNMFIDTTDYEEMNLLASLTLRCVKVVGDALQHINDKTKLQTFALLGVFGAEGEVLSFQDMKVLCLGLSTPAKDVVIHLPIVQCRIEVEGKLQSKTVPEGDRRRTDFLLTDPWFLRQWLPGMGSTLQHLCRVDYGRLANMLKPIKTLDLRNMFIDTTDYEGMNLLASLTLRCVKVVGDALQHINDKTKLQTFALLGVFGAEGEILSFQDMKVLCLGLSTPAKDVVIHLPKLEKLQLKMQCPQKLINCASVLKYVPFNLGVLEPSKVDLKSTDGLRELLYDATIFITLSDLVEKNAQHLKRIFLDIPCMALGEDGRFLGLDLKSMDRLRELLYCATSFITLSNLIDKNVQHLEMIFTSNETSRAMLSFVYQYLLGFDIDRGGSKPSSRAMLSFVYQYLLGFDIDRGGSKPSSRAMPSFVYQYLLGFDIDRGGSKPSSRAMLSFVYQYLLGFDIDRGGSKPSSRAMPSFVYQYFLGFDTDRGGSKAFSRATLSFVYQYLLGFDIDRGGSKVSSSSSLDFRDIFISIVLFQGSYVWIKFRGVARKGVYCRSTRDKQGRKIIKYEPRFKPPREKGLGSSKSHSWIYLGQFDTPFEANIHYLICAFYYGKSNGQLDLGDGSFFQIPSMNEEEQSLCGTAKMKWVKVQVKRVYEEFKKEKAARNLPPTSREPQGKDDVAELFQEMLADFEAEMPKEDGQVNMEGCIDDQGNEFNVTSLQFQPPFLANQTLDVGMNNATQGQFAQLAPNTDDGFTSNTNNQVGLLQILVSNQLRMQQQISELLQQVLELPQQIFELQQQEHLHQQIQEFNTQS